jgi:hypothetical protein
MSNNKYLAWTSFIIFVLNLVAILIFLVTATLFSDRIENPGIIVLVIGVFSLLGTIMGFLSFKAPQAKVGGIGGLVILLLVLFIIPVGRETSVLYPQPEVSFQEQAGVTGIRDIDSVIDTVLSGDQGAIRQLLQFSTLACTHANGLGGPPMCKEGEPEGTMVEAFPFLGPEGHHMRVSDLDSWMGIEATGVYAVYRVSPRSFSDIDFPAGNHAIVFLTEQENLLVTVQVTDGKIVRIDNHIGNPPVIDFERDASAIIYKGY